MRSKYHDIDNSFIKEYVDRLIGKVFKLLPLREEGNDTLNKYHESLMYELTGFKELFEVITDKAEFVSLLASLESITKIDDFTTFRSKVFECISMIKSLQ